jgi:hypothetical protein
MTKTNKKGGKMRHGNKKKNISRYTMLQKLVNKDFKKSLGSLTLPLWRYVEKIRKQMNLFDP